MQFYRKKKKNRIWFIKCQCATIIITNLHQSVRFTMDYIWVNFGIHISYHYWNIAIYPFLGSILIWSVKCTIGQNVFFLHLTRSYFQKSISFVSNQKFAQSFILYNYFFWNTRDPTIKKNMVSHYIFCRNP